jgi:hypothetical protein
MASKLMDENEAIERFVDDGDSVYVGYTAAAYGLCMAPSAPVQNLRRSAAGRATDVPGGCAVRAYRLHRGALRPASSRT